MDLNFGMFLDIALTADIFRKGVHIAGVCCPLAV